VVGIPTLVLLLPFLTLLWAIITLNRHAKKVLLYHQRVKRSPEGPSMTQRFTNLMNSTSTSFGFNKSANSMAGYKRLGALGMALNNNNHNNNNNKSTTTKNKPNADGSITSTTSALTATSTTASVTPISSSKSVSFAGESTPTTATSSTTKYKKPRSKSWSFRPRVSFGPKPSRRNSHCEERSQ
jgi:hypothetical protein